jgi:4-hydroxybenzoyl-CoA thioesterase
MSYESRQPVRFSDIDRAGIVYYPRFFDYWHRAFEDFFTDDVGIPYHRVIDERRIGFPVVKVEGEFKIPLQHGDLIRIVMTTARLGERSVTMRYRTYRPGVEAVAAEGRVTQACVDMDAFRSVPIPDDLRAALERHREAP